LPGGVTVNPTATTLREGARGTAFDAAPCRTSAQRLRVALLPTLLGQAGTSMVLYPRDLFAGLAEVHGVAPTYCDPPFGESASGSFGRRWLRYVRYPRWCREQQADIFHVTDHANAQLLLALPAERTVVTCHDLYPLAVAYGRGNFFGTRDRIRMIPTALRLRFLRRAAAVVPNSQHTWKECQDYLGIPCSRLFLAYHGKSDLFQPAQSGAIRQSFRARYGIPAESIAVLHVGGNDLRKNLRSVVRSVAALRDRSRRAASLVKVGSLLGAAEKQVVASLGLQSSVIETGPLGLREIVEAFQASDVLLYPSFHEGFCKPVVEAMACGLPVVAARRGAIPEVVQDTAPLFEPEDVEGMAGEILRLANSSDLRAERVERGRDAARRFTWRAHAEAVAEAYRAVAARWV
jgi:glycosyltransferase involved in cell wall biosynthesis